MVTGLKGANMTANAIGTQVTIKDATSKSDRRSNKPIMEKRRRARINNCLNELKTLILDATKKDPARHSKLEKADILEKTVKHLQELQRQQAALAQAVDPKVINKFKAGFTDCANEVSRFPGLEPNVKRRLLQHLSICINGVKTELHQHQRIAAAQQSQKLHAHMLPSPPSSPEQDQQMHNIVVGSAAGTVPQPFATTASVPAAATQIQATPNGFFLPNGLQVIPTKLPNGSIALVLPQSLPQQNTQPPMLVPIPSRTASTSSASSHVSSSYERTLSSPLSSTSASMHYAPPSPANSYETMDSHRSVIHHASAISSAAAAQQYHHHQQQQQQQQHQQQQQQHHHHHHLHQMQQPLSLVVKKDMREQEDQPWRPW